ncbi:endolytic transglycosylase MltG [Pararhizobium sp. IMCC21322]|uniref:endolytic transglycosylase MltG n=1 Tax=Pararhizobium sp. IMCC21322 TaxID=3067903 RepID=UPI0027411214|nr:endolytic transglycosylase MltG [Pararhizobium sp. IMCC21322]
MTRSRRGSRDSGHDRLDFDSNDRRYTPRSARQSLQSEIAAPPPSGHKHGRHPIVFLLNFLLMSAVFLVVGLGALLYYGKSVYEADGPLTVDKTVLIERGMNTQTIANLLDETNVINNKVLFLASVRVTEARGRLKAGEYLFEDGVSMEDVVARLVEGKSILHTVTVPEGRTSKQIVDILNRDSVLTGEIVDVPAEGTLLPETYKFTRGDNRAQILERMRTARDRAVSDVWSRRSPDLPISTPEEMVILASIVEKETALADERPRVASVFINRLKQGMRLQTDPTVIYGIVGGEGSLGRPISRADLRAENPYNTYVIDGLPPGPIANPGRAALEAVINPARTDDLFFVADGSGGHAFAKTFAEHQANVRKWREIERDKSAQAESTDEDSVEN